MIVTCKSRCEKGGQILDIRQPVNRALSKRLGLVSWWKSLGSGGNSLRDLMRTGNITLAGAEKSGPTARPGGYGSVIFDGVDDYGTSPDQDAFDFDRTSPYSLVAWAFTSVTAGGPYPVIAKHDGTRGYDMMVQSGKLTSHLTALSGGGFKVAGNTTIDDSRWHFLVVTYSGSGIVTGFKLYVDSISQSITIITNTLTGSTVTPLDLGIGARINQGLFFPGRISDPRIFNRALTESEVRFIRIDDMRGNPRLLNWIDDNPAKVRGAAIGGGSVLRSLIIEAA